MFANRYTIKVFLTGITESSSMLKTSSDDTSIKLETTSTVVARDVKPVVRRKRITVQEKYEILKGCDAGEKRSNLAEKYGIAVNTISMIMKQKDRIFTEMESHSINGGSKSLKTSAHPWTDEALYQWFLINSDGNAPISGTTLLEKANEFVAMERGPGFTVSRGFVDKWKQRHGICMKNNSAPPTLCPLVQAPSELQTLHGSSATSRITHQNEEEGGGVIEIMELTDDITLPARPSTAEVTQALDVLERLAFHLTSSQSASFDKSLEKLKKCIERDTNERKKQLTLFLNN